MRVEPHTVGLPGNWGATADEVGRAYPCDGLIPHPDDFLFRAVTVHAQPAVVFRWLCQLRAAPYSYDWIDNRGRESPRQLTPGLDDIQIGQRACSIFEVASFARDTHLTLVIADPPSRTLFGDVAVTYAVFPTDGADARLVVKIVVHYPTTLLHWPARRLLPWGDLVMMRKQLLNLKELAERTPPPHP